MELDIRTLGYVLVFLNLIQLFVFFYQYRMNKNYQGSGWWLMWTASLVLGFLFFLLRDISPFHQTAIFLQNSFIITGVIFLYVGVMRFFDKKENLWIIGSVFSVFLASLLFFLVVKDIIWIRGVIIASTVAFFSFMSTHALFTCRLPFMTATAHLTGCVFLVNGVFFVLRAGFLFNDLSVTVYEQTYLNAATYIDALVCGILLTFLFIVMINQRLQEEMKEAKEEMDMLFNSSPDGTLISRLDDGRIVFANEVFWAFSGFSRKGNTGKSIFDLNIWVNPEDPGKITSLIREKGFIEGYETEFQRQDKSRFHGLVSAKIISLQNVPHIISITRNVTERIEREMKLKELVSSLQKALEEIKTLRGIIPICSCCKKIRDDKGYWEQVESYVSRHSDASFSHSICPDCVKKLYPNFHMGGEKKK